MSKNRTAAILSAAIALPAGALASNLAQAGADSGRAKAAIAAGPAGGSVADQFKAAVARLEQAGSLDRSQADAIDRQVDAGSVDPEQLTRSGVLTGAQMRAVATATQGLKQ
jgi:hypothetical protein